MDAGLWKGETFIDGATFLVPSKIPEAGSECYFVDLDDITGVYHVVLRKLSLRLTLSLASLSAPKFSSHVAEFSSGKMTTVPQVKCSASKPKARKTSFGQQANDGQSSLSSFPKSILHVLPWNTVVSTSLEAEASTCAAQSRDPVETSVKTPTSDSSTPSRRSSAGSQGSGISTSTAPTSPASPTFPTLPEWKSALADLPQVPIVLGKPSYSIEALGLEDPKHNDLEKTCDPDMEVLDHLDLAPGAKGKQALMAVPKSKECLSAGDDLEVGIAIDGASGKLYLTPKVNAPATVMQTNSTTTNTKSATGASTLAEDQPTGGSVEQPSRLEYIDLTAEFNQGATDLDEEEVFSEPSTVNHHLIGSRLARTQYIPSEYADHVDRDETPVHHYNSINQPVSRDSRIPSAVSYWAAMASFRKKPIIDGTCWQAVVLSQAARWVDPCSLDEGVEIPDDLLLRENSTALRNFLTGRTAIQYGPRGTWTSDICDPDQERPQMMSEENREAMENAFLTGTLHQGLQRPYFMAPEDRDVTVNDDGSGMPFPSQKLKSKKGWESFERRGYTDLRLVDDGTRLFYSLKGMEESRACEALEIYETTDIVVVDGPFKAGPKSNSEIQEDEVEDNVSEAETEIPNNEVVIKREPIHFQSMLLLTAVANPSVEPSIDTFAMYTSHYLFVIAIITAFLWPYVG